MTLTERDQKTTKKPLVSIVLQTYNRKNMLVTALNSAKNQTYNNIEILIGDNHSEDDTEEYCLSEAKNDDRIKYFRHSENMGMVNNANFLLDRVSGEYFIFLNDDDWLDDDYVEKCVNCLTKHPDYSMVCPSTVLYPHKYMNFSKKIGRKCLVVKLDYKSAFKRLKTYLESQDGIEMSSGCFSTPILRDIKCAEGQYIIDRYNEDIILIMKFLAKGKCKVLSDTHMNKRDGGFSRDIKKGSVVYTSKGINEKNLMRRRCKIFSDVIISDKYFAELFSEKSRIQMSKKLFDSLCWFYCQGKYANKVYYHKLVNSIKFLYKYRLYKI